MQKIAVENNNNQEIVGIHSWSTCDVRHPVTRGLEKMIEATIERSHNAIRKARRDMYLAMAREAGKDEIQLFKNVISELKSRAHAELTQMYAAMRDASLVNQLTVKNIIPTAGRSVIALWIIGDNTYDAANGANYGSLGDDNTAPANGDTTLGNETYRKARSSEGTAANVAYLSNFYSAAEVTGTFEEAGWHIDGTGSADTGQLLSHFLTGSITKTSVETLTVESTLTIS